ncbi:MAG: hypothetical protein ACE5JD_17835 [Candidatus Methylomirabilia bacterium]
MSRRDRPPNDPRDRELTYAWVIVALAFFALAVAMGTRSTIGLLFRPWEHSRDKSPPRPVLPRPEPAPSAAGPTPPGVTSMADGTVQDETA